jgi:hypothetical protein
MKPPKGYEVAPLGHILKSCDLVDGGNDWQPIHFPGYEVLTKDVFARPIVKPSKCTHPAYIQFGTVSWCPKCGALKANGKWRKAGGK